MRLLAFALGIAVGVLIVNRRSNADGWQTLWSRDTVNASRRMVALGFAE